MVADTTGLFASPVAVPAISNNIQLTMIPDKLIIFCRRLNMVTSYADALLPITNVNINFNNNAGLLSSMTRLQLYKASVASGLKNMSWDELSGATVSVSDALPQPTDAEPASGFAGVGAHAVLFGAPLRKRRAFSWCPPSDP